MTKVGDEDPLTSVPLVQFKTTTMAEGESKNKNTNKSSVGGVGRAKMAFRRTNSTAASAGRFVFGVCARNLSEYMPVTQLHILSRFRHYSR